MIYNNIDLETTLDKKLTERPDGTYIIEEEKTYLLKVNLKRSVSFVSNLNKASFETMARNNKYDYIKLYSLSNRLEVRESSEKEETIKELAKLGINPYKYKSFKNTDFTKSQLENLEDIYLTSSQLTELYLDLLKLENPSFEFKIYNKAQNISSHIYRNLRY